MASPISAGSSIWIKARNVIAAGERLTDDSLSVSVTYASTLDGAPSISGALAWEPYGLEGQWAAIATAPSAPGHLTVVITAQAVVDGVPVRGEFQQSAQII